MNFSSLPATELSKQVNHTLLWGPGAPQFHDTTIIQSLPPIIPHCPLQSRAQPLCGPSWYALSSFPGLWEYVTDKLLLISSPGDQPSPEPWTRMHPYWGEQ